MEADSAASMDTTDRAACGAALNGGATIETENVFTQTNSRTNEESLLNSGAAAAFPGNMTSGTVIAMGEDPGTHWVAFQAKDMGALLSGVEAFMSSDDFAKYSTNAREFRKVEGRYISRTILALGSE